jgi:hypothetical protein
MRKRKVSFKREKTENPNRKVVLWSGQSAPFKIAPSNFVTKAEWIEMVKENERKIVSKKKKKKSNP